MLVFMKRFLIFLLAATSYLVASETDLVKDTPTKQVEEQKVTPKHEDTEESAKPIDEMHDSYQKAFVKTSIVLVIILILVFVCFWLYKRLMRTRIRSANHMRNIKVIERRPISPKTILYLLEVGKEQVLIAESQLEVRTIKQFNWNEAAPPAEVNPD